jgi:hypothetical protein
MKSPSLKDKAAYYAKVREANYANSLRLEGFTTPSKSRDKSVPAASRMGKLRRKPV